MASYSEKGINLTKKIYVIILIGVKNLIIEVLVLNIGFLFF